MLSLEMQTLEPSWTPELCILGNSPRPKTCISPVLLMNYTTMSNSVAQYNLNMWSRFLDTWNGKSIFHDDNFIDSDNLQVHVYTNTSGNVLRLVCLGGVEQEIWPRQNYGLTDRRMDNWEGGFQSYSLPSGGLIKSPVL